MYRKKQKVTHHYRLRSACKRKNHTVSYNLNNSSHTPALNNNAERRDFDKCITTLERKLADKGTLLNLNNPFKEQELRKLKPEFEKIGAQLELDKNQLLKKKEWLDKLLEEKRRLEKLLYETHKHLYENAKFEKRLLGAKEKLEHFSNENMKLMKSGKDAARENINSLPSEILMRIFSYFRHNELTKTAQVCRKWNVLSRSHVFWQTVSVKLPYSDTASVEKFLRALPSCVTCLKIKFESDYFNFEEICVILQEKCPHLQVLALCDVTFTVNFESVIDLCTQFLCKIKRLVLHDVDFTCHSRSDMYFGKSKIEALDIVRCDTNLTWSPFSKMPCLKTLNLESTDMSGMDDDMDWRWYGHNWFEDDLSLNQLEVLNLGFTSGIVSSTALENILRNGINLKELYLCNLNLMDYDFEFYQPVIALLKTVCLRGCHVTCNGVVSLIQSCQTLDNVYVNDYVAESYALHPFVKANTSMLEKVKPVDLCDNHVKDEFSS